MGRASPQIVGTGTFLRRFVAFSSKKNLESAVCFRAACRRVYVRGCVCCPMYVPNAGGRNDGRKENWLSDDEGFCIDSFRYSGDIFSFFSGLFF